MSQIIAQEIRELLDRHRREESETTARFETNIPSSSNALDKSLSDLQSLREQHAADIENTTLNLVSKTKDLGSIQPKEDIVVALFRGCVYAEIADARKKDILSLEVINMAKDASSQEEFINFCIVKKKDLEIKSHKDSVEKFLGLKRKYQWLCTLYRVPPSIKSLDVVRLIIVQDDQDDGPVDQEVYEAFHLLSKSYMSDASFNKKELSFSIWTYLQCRPDRYYWERNPGASSNSQAKELAATQPAFSVRLLDDGVFPNPLSQLRLQWTNECDKVDFGIYDNKNIPIEHFPWSINYKPVRGMIDVGQHFVPMLNRMSQCASVILHRKLYRESDLSTHPLKIQGIFTAHSEIELGKTKAGEGRVKPDLCIMVQRPIKSPRSEEVNMEPQKAIVFEIKTPQALNNLKIGKSGETKVSWTHRKLHYGMGPVPKSDDGNTFTKESNNVLLQVATFCARGTICVLTDGVRFTICQLDDKSKTLHLSRMYQLCDDPRVGIYDEVEMERLIAGEAADTLFRRYHKGREVLMSVVFAALKYSLVRDYSKKDQSGEWIPFALDPTEKAKIIEPVIYGSALTSSQSLVQKVFSRLSLRARGSPYSNLLLKLTQWVLFLCLWFISFLIPLHWISFGKWRCGVYRPIKLSSWGGPLPIVLNLKLKIGAGEIGKVFGNADLKYAAKVSEIPGGVAREMELAGSLLPLAEEGRVPIVYGLFQNVFTGTQVLLMDDCGRPVQKLPLPHTKDRRELMQTVVRMHELGVHHHDISEANVLRRPNGSLVLADLSLAVFERECVGVCPDKEFLNEESSASVEGYV